jgi:hypothetical protein
MYKRSKASSCWSKVTAKGTTMEAIIAIASTSFPILGLLQSSATIGTEMTNSCMSHDRYHDWNMH